MPTSADINIRHKKTNISEMNAASPFRQHIFAVRVDTLFALPPEMEMKCFFCSRLGQALPVGTFGEGVESLYKYVDISVHMCQY